MKLYNNTYVKVEDYYKIMITKSTDSSYFKEVLIDSDDLEKVSKFDIRLTTQGYPVIAKTGQKPLAHIVMNHISNTTNVVDHISGDKLDNRKCNLRVLSSKNNANNRNKALTETGEVGITLRTKGNYTCYRATVSDRVTKTVSKAKSQTKRYAKQFNVNKFGKEEALRRAIQWLEQKRIEFGYVDY